jgi:hypothetical protein
VRKDRKRGRRRGRTHERPARDVCNHGIAPWSGTPPQKRAAPASFRSCPRNAEGIIAAFQFAELRHVRGSSRIKLHHFPGRCERSHRRIFGGRVSMSAFGGKADIPSTNHDVPKTDICGGSKRLCCL